MSNTDERPRRTCDRGEPLTPWLSRKENHLFYFRPDEFRRLFPARVVGWMIAHPREEPDDPERKARRDRLRELGYPLTKAQLQAATGTRNHLRKARACWQSASAAEEAPRPRPVLRPRPQI